MRSCLLFVCFFLCSGTLLLSQNTPREDPLRLMKSEGEGSQVRISLDSLVEANYYKLLTQSSSLNGVPGYRIRIYSESGVGAKEEQQRVRANFLSLDPDVDAYYRYDEPYFKVYVGDCRTRSEALKLYDRKFFGSLYS